MEEGKEKKERESKGEERIRDAVRNQASEGYYSRTHFR